MPSETDPTSLLQRTLKRLVIATVLLYLVLLSGGIWVYFEGRTTNKALCTLRDDLTIRVLSSIKFLKEHPKGLPGIPASTLIESIENQQRTILALKDLDCSTEIPELNTPTVPTTTSRRNP